MKFLIVNACFVHFSCAFSAGGLASNTFKKSYSYAPQSSLASSDDAASRIVNPDSTIVEGNIKITEGEASIAEDEDVSLPIVNLAPTESVEKILAYGEVDVDAAFAKSTFPIAPADLIIRAKELLGPEIELGTKDGGECLADDFEFCAAVVGPIPKKEYLGALKNFNLKDSFDITSNFFGFCVDPIQTNRVWFMSRSTANHIAPFMGAEPTDKKIVYPPETFHLDFNEDSKLKEVGFYTSDRRAGNTGGLGGAFGFMYAVGKPLPIPECAPYKPSKRFRLLQLVGNFAKRFEKKS